MSYPGYSSIFTYTYLVSSTLQSNLGSEGSDAFKDIVLLATIDIDVVYELFTC